MSVTGKTPAGSATSPNARTSSASKKLYKVGRPQASEEHKIKKKRKRAEKEKQRREDLKKRYPAGTDFYQTEPKITIFGLVILNSISAVRTNSNEYLFVI